MYCYKIELSKILRVILIGKETLSESRVHYTRYVAEHLLYVVVSGKLDLLVNDERVVISAGETYLFKPGDYQMPLEATDAEYYYVHFLSDESQTCELEMNDDEYYRLINEKHTKNLKTPFYSAHCYDFMSIYLKKHGRIASKSLFEHIVSTLKSNRIQEEARSAERRFQISAAFADVLFKIESADDKKLISLYSTAQKITDYIERNYDKSFTGEDVERDLFISFDYANRVLGKALGTSIIKYRNTVRIDNAKVKIRTSNIPMSEIAAAVGFENGYYFSRTFKKIVGISPTEYKQKILYGKMKGDK